MVVQGVKVLNLVRYGTRNMFEHGEANMFGLKEDDPLMYRAKNNVMISLILDIGAFGASLSFVQLH